MIHVLIMLFALTGVLLLGLWRLRRQSTALGVTLKALVNDIVDVGLLRTPRRLSLWIAKLAWLGVTAKFLHWILQPIWDAPIRQEYMSMRAGIMGATIAYVIFYLLPTAAYVWFVTRHILETKNLRPMDPAGARARR